jgi:hypothetical protein
VSSDPDPLERLPRGMREAIEATLAPGEPVVEVFGTRGFGANALVCTPTRALISKRTVLRWSVGVFPYSEIDSVEMIEGRPGAAVQVELRPRDPGPARPPGPFDDFPDAYYQESRRLVAANTLVLRNRRRGREAVEALDSLLAEHRSP